MKVVVKGKKLTIELDMDTPTPSKSGKSLVVASTHGIQPTTVEIEGKPLQIGVNAFISA